MTYGEVERFLRRTGIKPTVFGREAANDPRLVFDLRNGRELRPRTANRVRAYMVSRLSGMATDSVPRGTDG